MLKYNYRRMSNYTHLKTEEYKEEFAMNNQAKKTKLIVINVALFILVPLLIFVGYKAYTILSEYMRAAQEYREIQDVAIDEIRTDEKDEASIVVDFSKLAKINPEVVGWIRFEEPKIINYPIVQGKDNKKYLSSTFEGTENGAGCIYMDADNSGDFADRNTFVYGHYKKNGHMFGSLGKYKDADYYTKHPYFNIYTPNGEKNTYQIFAVTVVAASSDSYKKVYVNDEEYKNYIQMIQKLSLYETGVEVKEDSYIVSLSTCTNVRVEERLIIHGVRIKQEQTK